MSDTPLTYAYIGLGSNMGDRHRHLTDALERLNGYSGITVTAVSSVYETEPVGYADQDAFLNMAAEIAVSLTADELLAAMMDVERSLGRVRDVRWGPRTIDLDLLLFGNERRQSEALELPHPRMLERAFVLVPLIEAAAKRDDSLAEWLQGHLEKLDRKEGVTLWRRTQ